MLLYQAMKFRPDILPSIRFLTCRIPFPTSDDMRKLNLVVIYNLSNTSDLIITRVTDVVDLFNSRKSYRTLFSKKLNDILKYI